MSMLNPNNYYTVAGWMLTDLGLRGNELTAYAVVYGFSQVADHRYHGSTNYLAEWMGVSQSTAIRALKALVDKGLLTKFDKEVNGVKFCEYAAVIPENRVHDCNTPCQNDIPPYVNLTHNNIDNSNSNITPVCISADLYRDKAYDISQPTQHFLPTGSTADTHTSPERGASGGKSIPYQAIVDSYNECCPSLPRCKLLTDKRKKAIKSRFADGFTAESLTEVFRKAEASTFLKGGGAHGFVANFDFLTGEKAAKVLEGVYDDNTPGQLSEQPTEPKDMRGYLTDEEFDALFALKKERK